MSSLNKFANIGFEDFRQLATDDSLSKYERIGFPDSYRRNYEEVIFADICSKLTNLRKTSGHIMDIGPGCSDLPRMLIDLCREQKHELLLVDSQEMLDQLPEEIFIEKVNALYPNCQDLIAANQEKIDVILCYSVLHYIMVDVPFFKFLDASLSLLAAGGQMLIGDIPNISKRKRFFSSDAGISFHQEFMQTENHPDVSFNCIEHNQIDDAVIFAILQRARAAGFDAYVLPQLPSLPMANRREDILIIKP